MHKTVEESVAWPGIEAGLFHKRPGHAGGSHHAGPKPVADELAGSGIFVAGQNLFWEDQGAYTAEVSGPMLKAAGASHVIIGHSERRQYFGETEKTVCLRLHAALKAGLVPYCVHRRNPGGSAKANGPAMCWKASWPAGLAGLSAQAAKGIILAYEPVWAIGTGKTASDEQANDAHAHIRGWMASHFDKDVASAVQILYGGSVKPANAAGLLGQEEVDGALVGGRVACRADFLGIIRASNRAVCP